MQPREALRQYFGHSDFRRGQRKLIEAVLGGRDVLGVMPTGGGKSMCYQIPARRAARARHRAGGTPRYRRGGTRRAAPRPRASC